MSVETRSVCLCRPGTGLELRWTYPNSKVAFALSHGLLVCLPLVRSAGLGHVGGLLPPQTLPKLVHLRGHVLPRTADTEKPISSVFCQIRLKQHQILSSQTHLKGFIENHESGWYRLAPADCAVIICISCLLASVWLSSSVAQTEGGT